MRTKHTLHFDGLARDLAMTVGATVRRWWLEPKNAQCFHVEAVRTFVGAKPVVVQFAATLDTARPPQLRGQAQMQVITEPPRSALPVPSTNGTSRVVQRRPRITRRPHAAQPRTRTGPRSAATTRPRTVTTRSPGKTRSRRRARARR